MSNLNAERMTIAAKLNDGGVEATTDPKCVPPAVLVANPTVVGTEGIGGWSVEYPIHILGASPGNEQSLSWMLDQVEKVLVAFFGAPAVPRTIDHAGADVPGYVVTLLRSVTSPNC